MKTLSDRGWLCLSTVALCMLMAGLCVSIPGCGKLETGAHAEPSVRIKLADLAPGDLPPGDGKTPGENPISSGVGTFVGRVKFKGTPPAAKILFGKGGAPRQPEVCSATGDIPNEELIVSSEGGIANVFVYLDKPPPGFKDTPPTETLLFDQKNCIFTTHAMIIRVGQPMKVLNADSVPHNTHTYPNKNDQENMLIQGAERGGISLLFKKAEKYPFGVKCDLHNWMTAYQLPLDHPFGAVTDKNGNFKIENLPAGSYFFKVWHEAGQGGGFLETKYKATVKPGVNDEVTIEVSASKLGL